MGYYISWLRGFRKVGAALYVSVAGKKNFLEREKGVVEVFRFLNLVTGSLARYFLKKLYSNSIYLYIDMYLYNTSV